MNSEINRLRDLFDSENLYFSVSWKDKADKDHVLSPLSEENKGGAKFLELYEKAKRYGAETLIVKIYTKNDDGSFRKRPDFEETIPMRIAKALDGLGEFDLINTKVELGRVSTELMNNQRELSRLERENEKLREKNEQLHRENTDLREKTRKLEWEVEKLKYLHEINIENIKRKQNTLDKVLTLGGTALVKAVGLDDEALYGLLGMDDMPTKKHIPAPQNDVQVEIEQRDEQKAEAYEILDNITEIIQRNIEMNPQKDAIRYAQALQIVINYIHGSQENFNRILSIITQPQTQNTESNEIHDKATV